MNLCVMVVMGKHFPDLLRLFKVEEAVALKELAKESHEEGHQMRQLTVRQYSQSVSRRILILIQERSTKDAASVKILTVIFLMYLPLTIVAVRSLPPQRIHFLSVD